MLATTYAKALYELKDKATTKGLRALLERHGHTKLMPQIYREYQKLLLQEQRLRAHKKVTPERERTRVLLELYRTLTHV